MTCLPQWMKLTVNHEGVTITTLELPVVLVMHDSGLVEALVLPSDDGVPSLPDRLHPEDEADICAWVSSVVAGIGSARAPGDDFDSTGEMKTTASSTRRSVSDHRIGKRRSVWSRRKGAA